MQSGMLRISPRMVKKKGDLARCASFDRQDVKRIGIAHLADGKNAGMVPLKSSSK